MIFILDSPVLVKGANVSSERKGRSDLNDELGSPPKRRWEKNKQDKTQLLN